MNKICGIYKIQSISKPERFYIGSSNSINRRFVNHRYCLKANTHKSPKLQNHYNKYTKDDLVFLVIEECDVTQLIGKEQVYLDSLQPYFNICKAAFSSYGRPISQKQRESIKYCHTEEAMRKSRLSREGFKHSDSTKEKIRLKALNRPKSNKTLDNMRNSSLAKSIIQLDLSGNVVREWHCLKCASKELNIQSSSISHCLKLRRKTAGGFKWAYTTSAVL